MDRNISKIYGEGQMCLQGEVQNSFYDIMALLLACCYYRQKCHDVALWTTKQVLNEIIYIEIKELWKINHHNPEGIRHTHPCIHECNIQSSKKSVIASGDDHYVRYIIIFIFDF